MSSTIARSTALSRLNTVGKLQPAKAKLTDHAIVTAANLVKLAIARSGIQSKALGDDKAQTSKKISGLTDHKLWFHEMVADWPPAVWRELLPLLALEVCGEYFDVKRSVTIEEKRRT